MKILIITPKRLGECLIITPCIRFLKKHVTQLHINIITTSYLATEVFIYNNNIDTIILEPNIQELQQLSKIKYDHILFLNQFDKYLLNYLPFKLFPKDYDTCLSELKMIAKHKSLYALNICQDFLQQKYNCITIIKITDIMYDLGLLGHNTMYLLFQNYDIKYKKDSVIVMHLGCHSLSKFKHKFYNKLLKRINKNERAYKLNNFIKLAKRLLKYNPSIKFLIIGSKNEKLLANKFCKEISQAINLVNKLDIISTFKLFNFINLYIGNDTGITHLALASTAKVVALYLNKHIVKTGACIYRHCEAKTAILHGDKLKNIKISQVYQSCIRLLNEDSNY